MCVIMCYYCAIDMGAVASVLSVNNPLGGGVGGVVSSLPYSVPPW